MVGLSGGVDSSVTALLLKQQGHEVETMFMKNWVDIHGDGQCPIEQDLKDARQVSDLIQVPFHTINFAPEYWDRVFKHFLDEYQAGRTPNPDILCNKEIKFDLFLNEALRLGADKMATGHYARIDERDGRYRLLKGIDGNKDQSYFLYTLNQYQLSRAEFPIGELEKPEVRAIATNAKLPTFAKRDSTGICFIGERNFSEFLGQYLPAQPGLIQTVDGLHMGEHQGLMFYTLGQRKGIGIGGRQDADEEPWYVIGKKLHDNVLVVAQGHNHPLLHSTKLHANNLHWTSEEPPSLPLRCTAKTRYRQSDQNCTITTIENGIAEVIFDQAQRAVTPGQSIVFYLDAECLGGAIIEFVDGIIYQ